MTETSRLLLPTAETLTESVECLKGSAARGKKLSQALTAAHEAGGSASLDSSILDIIVAAVSDWSDTVCDNSDKLKAAVAAIKVASKPYDMAKKPNEAASPGTIQHLLRSPGAEPHLTPNNASPDNTLRCCLAVWRLFITVIINALYIARFGTHSVHMCRPSTTKSAVVSRRTTYPRQSLPVDNLATAATCAHPESVTADSSRSTATAEPVAKADCDTTVAEHPTRASVPGVQEHQDTPGACTATRRQEGACKTDLGALCDLSSDISGVADTYNAAGSVRLTRAMYSFDTFAVTRTIPRPADICSSARRPDGLLQAACS
jgi:hypothetical protein